MTRRYPLVLLLLATVLGLSACESPESDTSTDKQAAVKTKLPVPATADDKLWKAYLQERIGEHMEGVTDRVIPYYLPADSGVVESDGSSKYDRLSEAVTAAVSRTVLPGNMLAFGSPDSAKMADLLTSAFSGARPDALKGSQVLFVGKAEDSARVQPLIEASGAKYIFVEAK
jgi:hypothetical protein